VSDRPEIRSLLSSLKKRPKNPQSSSILSAEQLHHAVGRNDADAVLRLVQEERVDPNIMRTGSTSTPLHMALAISSFDTAIFLVLAGANLEAKNKNDETAIISAVRHRFPDDFIALLCELGAEVDAVDLLGRSALHYAAEMAPEDNTILALCGHGASLDLRDKAGRNPLLHAVVRARQRSTAQLIDCGAQLAVATAGGKSALQLAIAKRDTGMVKMLCERGAAVNGDMKHSTPLMVAITSTCTDIARLLIEFGATPGLHSTRGNFPLLMASALGDKEIVGLLLARGADVNDSSQTGNTPLHMAAQKDHAEIAQLLVQAGAPLEHTNDDGSTPLGLAVHCGHTGIVKLLLGIGANPDSRFNSQPVLWCALQQVCSSGAASAAQENKTSPVHVQIAQLLIEAGASAIEPEGRLESTPLHQAARLGLGSTVELMLSHASNTIIETRTRSGHTPLFFAVEGGHLTTIRLLIEKHGADIYAQTAAGEHLLWPAAARPPILRYLLDIRDDEFFDVNHQNQSGATVLHFAAVLGQVESIKLLLRRGAKQFVAAAVYDDLLCLNAGKSCRQGTPAGLAKERGHKKVMELLQ
ncbi:ankyrin repeat-containing domain protein, partial [Bombardia bombarda]